MKTIDMSVLPEGFLIEASVLFTNGLSDIREWQIHPKNNEMYYAGLRADWERPLLNHWHFNDGSMVLPDGLVVEFYTFDTHDGILKGCTHMNSVVLGSHQRYSAEEIFELNEYPINPDWDMESHEIIAVNILGVTAEYGAQLGMEVIEL